MATWSRLIRFVDDTSRETFGEPIITDGQEFTDWLAGEERWAVKLKGPSPIGPLIRGERIRVQELRDLLHSSDVPIIRCIGLNYMKHIQEAGRKPPPYPSIFIKPGTSVAGFNEDVPIPKIAQDGTVDYEGELVSSSVTSIVDVINTTLEAIVIGKTGRDIPKESALDHIAGYCVSNDVSARAWQREPDKAGVVPQWCFSKGFDKFAPLGPVLVSPALVGNASDLHLRTFVNGEERQRTSTSDLIFGVEDIITFCSQGTTLEAGTIIMTGTPSGVAMGMKPPKYLTDGDVVEVTITGLGSVRNRMVFE